MQALAKEVPNICSATILIVDDNEINRIFLEKILLSRGFSNLVCVESGEEALRILAKIQPDLVILDILMPGMDGFECCMTIRNLPYYSNLPILIQTTITDADLRVKAFTMGATDLVSKPIYPEELCARVLVHLEKRYTTNILQLYKNRIQLELESARQLQLAILPTYNDLEDIKRRSELTIASHFQPSSEVGGDFWGVKDIFPHQTALWLVDFSGKGVAAALNAFRLQAYLKEHTPIAARPGEYLSHLNDKLLHLLLRGQFATMFYGIIDTQTNQLFYACACAPHPIIKRKSSNKAERMDGSGKPLGVGMHLYPTQSIPFYPGDILLLYSDALTETPNAHGNYIDEKHIIELLDDRGDISAEAVKERVLDFFYAHTAGMSADDLTLTICTR